MIIFKELSEEELISSKNTSPVSRMAQLPSTIETDPEVSHFYALSIIMDAVSVALGAHSHLTCSFQMACTLLASISVKELELSNLVFNVASAIVLISKPSP